MSQVVSESRSKVRELADKVLRAWDHGQAADARAALDRYPELAADDDIVGQLAYEEFCQRTERGEKLAAAAFAARFPSCRSSLCKTLLGHRFVDDNPLLLSGHDWPQPGDKFLGFSVVRELGRGSFARVYQATETALGNRPVALKVSSRGGAEAEILGRLRHDNIVPVNSIQQDPIAGLSVVCMPYLGQTTLCDVLGHAFAGPGLPERASAILDAVKPEAADEELARFKPDKKLLHRDYVEGVIELGVQMAEALAFVHERKIFHRDLKPSNVLVRPDGRPMLLDFNLSFDEQAKNHPLGGTLIYMAPEQLRATDPDDSGPCLLDARTDIFSLGVILYELLTGAHPFGPIPLKNSPNEVRRVLGPRQEAGPRPVRQANPGVDKRLAGVVAKCLAPKPKDRFASAAELAAALRQCLAPVQRVRRKLARRPKMVMAAAVAGFFLAVAAAIFLSMRPAYQERQFHQGSRAFEEGDYSQAIACFSRALAEDNSARSYFARGRAYLKTGDRQNAIDDFLMADNLQPSGATKASLAYCYTLDPPNDALAVGYYRKALKAGFETAAVYNNMGYCLLRMRGGDLEAAKCFQKAIDKNPSYQLAYYHRALVDLKAAHSAPELISPAGLLAMEKVFVLGPASARMHLDAARFYVLAEKLEARWKERALDHVQKAIDQGASPKSVRADTILRRLAKEPPFQQLAATQPPLPQVTELRRVEDPIQGLSE